MPHQGLGSTPMVRRSEIDVAGLLEPPSRGISGVHSPVGLGLTESEDRLSIGAESSPGPVGTPVLLIGNANLVAPLSRESLTLLEDS